MKKGEFTQKTKDTLAKRAGEKCSLCKKGTAKAHTDDNNFINLGEAAHIKGLKPGKNSRHDQNMTNQQRKDASNGIWLCNKCHKLIDSDAKKYTVEEILKIKNDHEREIDLDDFDYNSINEYKTAQQNISKLLRQKENLKKKIKKDDRIHSSKLAALIIELNEAKIENDALKENIFDLKNQLIKTDYNNPDSIYFQAYNALILNHNIQQAIKILDEKNITAKEEDISSVRLLKAKLYAVKKDFKNADLNFEKSLEHYYNYETALFYVKFLLDWNKFKKAINVLKISTQKEFNSDKKSHLLGYGGTIYTRIRKFKKALKYFKLAENIIDKQLEKDYNFYKINKAKLLLSLGKTYKGLGKFDDSLTLFEESLNIYWEMSIQEDKHYFEDLIELFNSIGLLYLEANFPSESISYFNQSLYVISESEIFDDNTVSIIHYNLSLAYSHIKILDIKSAKNHLIKTIEILREIYSENPIKYYEQLIAAYCKMGDYYLIEKNSWDALSNYQISYKFSQLLNDLDKRAFIPQIATFYTNFATFYKLQSDNNNFIKHIDIAINYFKKASKSDHQSKLSLGICMINKSEIINDINVKKELLSAAKSLLSEVNKYSGTQFWIDKINTMLNALSQND